MKKSFISKRISFLILFLMCSMLSMAYDILEGGIYYRILSGNTVEVTNGDKKYSGNVIIPSSISGGYKVIRIGNLAFEECRGLRSVTIPSSVTLIRSWAFYNCTGLTSVIIPSSVKTIEYRAFDSCSNLSSITISNGVEIIEGSAFESCSGLTNVTIPSSVISIGERAFGSCIGLKNLIISEGITNIGSAAFADCINLISVSFPSSVNTISSSVLSGCTNLTKVTIPANVTSIGADAFSDCSSLTSITIPANVASIGQSAFANCKSLKDIIIPSNVTSIGICAFSGCSSLTNITMPSGVTAINSGLFQSCTSLTSITIPSNATIIGEYAFYNCTSLKSVTIPASVSNIGEKAFEYCSSLTSVTIPKGVTAIGDLAFYYCENLSLVYSYIGSPFSISAFRNAYNKTLYVPKGTKTKYESTDGWKEFGTIKEESATTTLTLKAGLNGSLSYNGTIVTNGTKTISVEEGESPVITITPNSSYQLSKLTVNGTNVTSSVSNGKYAINNIQQNTTVEATFEEIPKENYTLTLKAGANGALAYNGTTVTNGSRAISLIEGTSATITVTPNTGYQLAKLTVNGTNVTSSVSNGRYTINNIQQNTTVEATFAEIPKVNYTLTLKAGANGSLTYNGTTVTNGSKAISVVEGTSATITITPNSGYQLAKLTVGGTNVTSSVSGGKYTVSNIQKNTTVEATFSEIPKEYYSLTLKAGDNGSLSYDGNTVSNGSKTISSILSGSSVTVTITPNSGYQLSKLTKGSTNVTSSVSNGKYTFSITANTTIEATFAEKPKDNITTEIEGTAYIANPNNNTATIGKGNYSGHLTLPSTINVNGTDYAVTTIEAGAFANCTGLISVSVPGSVTSIGKGVFTGCTSLAAVIWEPEVELTTTMTGTIGNPNLLLYVKDSKYAPSGIKNVVVNDVADNITLSDAKSGNNFYAPREFLARNISYTHNYSMTTGKDECRGWETLSLPFDVTMISHATKGELLPFSTWNKGNGKPFFLYQFGATGFTPAGGISANTPYIISMPNNAIYKAEYRVNGQVTFKATDKTVRRSDEVNTATNGNSTFIPNFTERQSGSNIYALNVVNAMGDYNSGSTEGSMFVRDPERMVHPFEAVMQTATAGVAAFGIFDDYTTAIPDIALQEEILLDSGYLYNLAGQAVRYVEGMTEREALRGLPRGIYMLRGKKVVVR